ncbi:MAG: GGDEF domain-containing protein [Acidobacteriota bacterium]
MAAAVATTTVLLFFLMCFVAMTRRVYPGFRHWTLALLMIFAAATIVSLYESTPPSIKLRSWIPSWTLLLGAAVVAHAGIRRFRGRPSISWASVAWGTTSLAAATLLHLRGFPDAVALLATSMGMAGILFAATWAATSSVRPALRPGYYLYGAVQFALGALCLVRALLVLADPTPYATNDGLSHTADALFFFGSQLGITAWIFSAVLITGQRQEAELHDAQRILRDEAGTDFLTGVANRRRFFARAAEMLEECETVSVLLLDIDRFKRVNDTYGHELGDQVLKNLAKVLKERSHQADGEVCRIGGEEFALLLPLVEPEAVDFAEELRQQIATTRLEASLRKPITASFGVAEVMPRATNLDEALRRADAALYKAKRDGRNRVELAENSSGQWQTGVRGSTRD